MRSVGVIVWIALLLVALTGCSGSAERNSESRGDSIIEPFDHLVLVTIDTLRADRVGCYGYPRTVSPFLDSLARQGVRFERTIASSSHTAPSHASMFTSQYPARHRVLRNGHRLRPAVPTLAGLLRDRGFETAGFTAMGFLKTISSGFETFDSKRGVPYRPAPEMVDRALAWFSGRSTEGRFFLWVHFYDVHNSGLDKLIPEPQFGRMQEDSAERRAELDEFWSLEQGLPADKLDEYRDRYDHYDAQIALVDEQLERLFAEIGAATAGERTLWVITADHGEGLGNHDFFGHGMYLYEEQLRVPLIVYGDERWRQGAVIEQMVRHVDLLPTIGELMGLELDSEQLTLEGRSLVPLLERPGSELKIDLAVSHRRPADKGNPRNDWTPGLVISARTERYKYILKTQGYDELYDLEADPFETTNLVGTGLEIESQLSTWLARKYQSMRQNPLVGAPADPEIAPEHVEELKALGYLN